MYWTHFIFVFLFYSATVDGYVYHTDVTSPSGYVHYQAAQGSLKVHPPADWRTARLTCFKDHGALLVSPENEDLLSAMMAAMEANIPAYQKYVFTGIHNTYSNRHFNSLEGTPLNELAAYGDHDISSKNEDSCLKMDKTGMLFESKCTDKLHFICYIKDPPTKATLDCRDGYTLSRKTSSCYKFHKEYVYWHEAFAACATEGAHLAIINSEEESQVLKDLFDSNKDGRDTSRKAYTNVVHIGFVDWTGKGGKDGLWMTIDGQTLQSAGFSKWDGDEPNNRINQLCGGMFLNGNLDDVNCGNGDPEQKLRSFICEKKPEIKTDKPIKADNINFNQNP